MSLAEGGGLGNWAFLQLFKMLQYWSTPSVHCIINRFQRSTFKEDIQFQSGDFWGEQRHFQ